MDRECEWLSVYSKKRFLEIVTYSLTAVTGLDKGPDAPIGTTYKQPIEGEV